MIAGLEVWDTIQASAGAWRIREHVSWSQDEISSLRSPSQIEPTDAAISYLSKWMVIACLPWLSLSSVACTYTLARSSDA